MMKLDFGSWSRKGLVLGTFAILIYFAIATARVPDTGFAFEWTATPATPISASTTFRLPSGVMRVISVSPEHAAGRLLQMGDAIMELSGVQPQRSPDWQSVFRGVTDRYDVTVLREGRTLHFSDLPVGRPTPGQLFDRFMLGLIALVTWLVGALMILHARQAQEDAMVAGSTLLAASVGLAAFGGQRFGVAWSWLASVPLLPLLAVAIGQTSLLPRSRPQTKREQRLFRLLYGLAGALALLAVADILWFQMHGRAIRLAGMWVYYWCLLALATGLTANPLILLYRLGKLQGYQRKQIAILLFFTGTAVLPFVFLTFLPDIIWDVRVLPQQLTLLLLSLIPLGYGYVIYRYRYLSLDFLVVRSLPTLLLSLAVVMFYSGVVLLFTDLQALPSPWITWLLFGSVASGPWLIVPFLDFIQVLVFGKQVPDQKTLNALTNQLVVAPDLSSLQQVLRDLPALVGASRAAMLILDKERQYIIDAHSVVDGPNQCADLEALLAHDYVLKPNVNTRSAPLFAAYEWAEALVTMRLGNKLLGWLILGPPLPDGHYNAQQIDVLKQFAHILSITVETTLLYQSTRDMAVDMLKVRDVEREQISLRLHDGPLQDLTMAIALLPKEQHQVRAHLRQAIGYLRDFVAALHSPVLKQSLAHAVQEAAREFGAAYGLPVAVRIEVPNSLSISDEMGNAFYQVLKESLHNVHKHAQASRVAVSLIYDGRELQLSVEDDGRGMDLPPQLSSPELIRQRHFGMVGMQQRMRLLGGRWTIARNEHGGMTMRCAAPLLAEQPALSLGVAA